MVLDFGSMISWSLSGFLTLMKNRRRVETPSVTVGRALSGVPCADVSGRRHLKVANTIQIFGIDIYDRQRAGVQEFQKLRGNLNAPLGLAPSTFDLINHRFLVDGINTPRWDSLLPEYRELLKPGGWLQMVEVQWTFQSQSNVELPALKIWSDTYFEALHIMQKNPLVARDLERRVRFAGFERFQTKKHQISIGEWRRGTYGAIHTLLSVVVGVGF
jgi:SAM-dependent methyltransferase